MTVGKFVQTDFTDQDSDTYKTNIDANMMVLANLGNDFAPYQSATPNMTITIAPGSIFINGTTVVSQAEQVSGTITAPVSNPRIDRVVIDAITATISIITGSEGSTPSPPPIPAGQIPVCQIALSVSQTSIVNANITDERCNNVGSPTNNLSVSPDSGIAVSEIVIGMANTERGGYDTSYTKKKQITVKRSGTFTVVFQINAAVPATAYGRIYKNGVALGTERTNTASGYVTFVESFAFVAGDQIQIYCKTSNGSDAYHIANFSVQAHDSNLSTIDID